jgi:hypothetical protein
MGGVPRRRRRDVLGGDEMQRTLPRLVDEHFGVVHVEHVIEQAELRQVYAHRAQLGPAHAAAVGDVSFRERSLDGAKARGRRSHDVDQRLPTTVGRAFRARHADRRRERERRHGQAHQNCASASHDVLLCKGDMPRAGCARATELS